MMRVHWSRRWRSIGVLAFLLLVAVGPFLGRPIHIDEPLFVWAARQMAREPLDFYGFNVNWTGTPQPMHEFAMNPPLTSYYVALVARLAGWNEAALHAAFVPVALAALIGTFALAGRFSSRPLFAALVSLSTPAFLVSSTMVMSDTLAVAFWVWALWLWDRGLREERTRLLAVAALLAGLAALTKYFAIALLPLLALSAALTARRTRAWLWALAIPLIMLVAYERVTAAQYGHSLLFGAASYASRYQDPTLAMQARKLVQGLAFTGGSAATLLFLSPVLLRWRSALVPVLLAVCLLGILGGWFQAQLLLWCVVGIGVLWLAIDDVLRTRRPEAAVLSAWVVGTFVFASFVNWTVNARSLLPLIPAVGILAARRLDRLAEAGNPPTSSWVAGGLATAAALSMAIVCADASLATASKTAAFDLVKEFGARGTPVWFQGHWGFQYYAELLGALPLDRRGSRVGAGEWIVRPANNSYLFPLPRAFLSSPYRREFPVPSWVSTMDPRASSGFYAATFGWLPFAVGGAQPELYFVYQSTTPFDLGVLRPPARSRGSRSP
jgi:4-amino-4-deoxy-L-arabinose transferase-like glycosyltransferase